MKKVITLQFIILCSFSIVYAQEIKNKYIDVFDNALYFIDSVEIYGEYDSHSKILYKRNNKGYIVQTIEKRFNGSTWHNHYRTSEKYDERMNRIQLTAENWLDGQWQLWSTTYYGYDDVNREINRIIESKTKNTRTTTEFLTNGEVTISQTKIDSLWTNTHKTTTIRNLNSQIIELYQYDWINNNWVENYKKINLYESDNLITSSELWNINNIFIEAKTENEYDENNNLILYTYLYTIDGTISRGDKKIYSFNDNNELIEEIYQVWNGIDFTNKEKYIYSNSIKKIIETKEIWYENAWTLFQEKAKIFDENNNLDSLITKGGLGELQNINLITYDYNTNSQITYELQQSWTSNNWSDFKKFIYDYNENNLLVNRRAEMFSGGNWGLVDESLLIKDSLATEYNFIGGEIILHYSTIMVNIEKDIVKEYKLFQNYPNPFNPTTTIKYSIPKQEQVTIKIYDILGKEIKTLVNEIKSRGNYQVDFDASSLASGIYFYRLQVNKFSDIKKLLLVK
ncbi:MAG: T9SS type A sorting domain-containing protein [Ignavibacteriae bacterium]|nr:T9SS type A sorting domain-containing protein [Ignavibacteriota bacterium]